MTNPIYNHAVQIFNNVMLQEDESSQAKLDDFLAGYGAGYFGKRINGSCLFNAGHRMGSKVINERARSIFFGANAESEIAADLIPCPIKVGGMLWPSEAGSQIIETSSLIGIDLRASSQLAFFGLVGGFLDIDADGRLATFADCRN